MNEGHLLIVAEEDDANFQVLQCSGFDKSTIHRLGSMPCMVRLRLHRSSVQELSTFERLTDMPGLQELCNLVTKIRACYVPRRRPSPPIYRIISSSGVSNQGNRRAWLRSVIQPDVGRGVLARNSIYGFQRPQSSHLQNSILFPEIKKIAQSWGFDFSGTVFE